MADTHGGFGFGAYIKEESNEELTTLDMIEEPKAEDAVEFVEEVQPPKPKSKSKSKPKQKEEEKIEEEVQIPTPPKYEISQRPMRPRKRR
jgi:hypothetical protein